MMDYEALAQMPLESLNCRDSRLGWKAHPPTMLDAESNQAEISKDEDIKKEMTEKLKAINDQLAVDYAANDKRIKYDDEIEKLISSGAVEDTGDETR